MHSYQPNCFNQPVCCLLLHSSFVLYCISFKQYINEVFAAKLDLLVNKLSHSVDSKAPVDLHELMYQFTLDTFGQIGFGVNPGCLASTTKVPFAAAFDRAQVVRRVPVGHRRQ